MTKDQARILAIRGALAHLYYLPTSSWIPDWSFHKPESQERLDEARTWVINTLVGLLGLIEDSTENAPRREELHVQP